MLTHLPLNKAVLQTVKPNCAISWPEKIVLRKVHSHSLSLYSMNLYIMYSHSYSRYMYSLCPHCRMYDLYCNSHRHTRSMARMAMTSRRSGEKILRGTRL